MDDLEEIIFEALDDWANEDKPTGPHLGKNGNLTGVVFHREFSEGAIISAQYARQLGAQLIRQADLHDAIYEAGAESMINQFNRTRAN